jgi:hypothetical protein
MTADGRPSASTTRDTPGSAEPVRVVYIVGAARSGSTLLSSLLGSMPGALAVAESRLLWRGVDERVCGCGRPVHECPAWGRVIERVARDVVPARDVEALQQRTIRNRHLPARLRRPASTDARAYGRLLGILHTTLAETTGAHTVVDSSKSVAEAALLRHVGGVDPVVVHLVRDPRAVAYSWERAYRRREGEAPSALRTARDWMATNAAAEALLLAYPAGSRVRIRYEDLVARPEDVRAAVADAGTVCPDGSAPTAEGHMVGGNLLRFGDRAPQLKLDVAWHAELASTDARAVTAATLPLLTRYGYPLNPRASS